MKLTRNFSNSADNSTTISNLTLEQLNKTISMFESSLIFSLIQKVESSNLNNSSQQALRIEDILNQDIVLKLQQDIEENSQLGDMHLENNQTDITESSTQESDYSTPNNQDSHKEQSTEESERTKDSQIDAQNDDTESLKGTSSQSKSTHSVNKEGYNTGLVILILIVLGLVGVLVIMALRGDSPQMRLKNKHWLYDQQQHSWDSSTEDDYG